MDFNKQCLSPEEAKAVDMVNYLASLGYEPAKVRNEDYWYASPLRQEESPSFKINRKYNIWYDHGLGKGGTIIDFGMHYFRCSIGEFLQKVGSTAIPREPLNHYEKVTLATEHKINIIGDAPIHSFALLRYLEQRKIPLDIARQFCREVQYELHDKNYFGIGFKNDLGGFEIRNPYFKTSSSPKGITSLQNGSAEIAVFEGFMDFLSFKAANKNLPEKGQDFVVLNSVSFFERARPIMESYERIRLYLDRDTTGQSYTQRALSLSTKYKDESILYKNHKDLNDWLINSGKPPKRHLGNKLM